MKSLAYVPDGGPLKDRAWRWERGGGETVFFKRVAAGVAPPKPDQPQGAVVVLGERYAQEGPPTFEALAAKTGLWMDVERGLRAFRRALKPSFFVTEPDEEAVDALRHVPDLREACSGRVPCAVIAAPPDAIGEIARQRVDKLVREGRLVLKPVQAVLDQAAEPAALALQCVVSWLTKYPARYGGRGDIQAANRRRARSYSGRPSKPDEPIPVPPMLGLRVEGQRLSSHDGKHDFGRVGRGGPVRPDLREANRRRARSWKAGFDARRRG